MGSGQQCCYRQNGTLLVEPLSGGTVDFIAPNGLINDIRHMYEDIIPAIFCCKGSVGDASSTCSLYYAHRPSDSGSRYNPPVPGNNIILMILL